MAVVNNQKKLNFLHLSIFPIWDLGANKGRISSYLPLKALCERGHKLVFLTSDPGDTRNLPSSILIKKLKLGIYKRNRKFWGTILFYIWFPFFIISCFIQGFFISLKFKPDIIYAHGIYTVIPAFLLSKLFCSKYIFRTYGIGDTKSIHIRSLYLMMKLPAQLYIITNDGTFGDILAKKYGVSDNKICFWVNGFNKGWILEESNNQLREKLSSKNQKIVLSLCRLVSSKQVDILINAIPEVLESYKSVKFVIVGDGEEKCKLENMSVKLGVSDFVSFEGAVEHSLAIEYIKSCDLFISMNSLSSISNPVLETMACGKAVIALNVGASSKLIKNRYNGTLIDQNDLNKLPEYIVYMLKNDEIRQNLGKNAQNFILNKWPSWEQRISLEISLIEALCSENSKKIISLKRNADRILNPLESSY